MDPPSVSDIENHLNKCRFCLGSLELCTDNVIISYEIERKFTDLVGIELRVTEEFSNIVCGPCYHRLHDLHEFQQRLFDVQTRLYQHIDYSNDDIKPNISHIDVGPASGRFSVKEEENMDFETYAPDLLEMEDFQESNDDWTPTTSPRVFKSKTCKRCGKQLDTEKSFRQHMRKHREEEAESDVPKGHSLCPICAKVLRTGSISVHLLTVHGMNPTGDIFYCDFCNYSSVRKRALVIHMANHKQQDPTKYQCRYCPETFAKAHAKRHHERRAHEEVGKKFECECGKTFNSAAGLYFHRKEIHEQGDFPCLICSENFTSKVKLKNHQDRLHMPKKICDVCGKLVPPGTLFFKHMQRHGPKVKCPVDGCEKTFCDRSYLSYHMQSEHGPQLKLNCPTCNAEFNTKRNLKRHIERQHESVSVPCEVPGCNYSSSRRSNLVAHYRTHKDLDPTTLERIFLDLKSIKMAG